ncbi:hypothetical protein [Paractinoplanes rishiriensis]|nr:hypothetical protein [Actinoplanes rishiriensis]
MLAAVSATVSTVTFATATVALAAGRHTTSVDRSATETAATLMARLHLAVAAAVAVLLPPALSQELISGLLPVTFAVTTYMHVVAVRDHLTRYRADRSRYPNTEATPAPPRSASRPDRPAPPIRRGSWRELL